jgi:cation diffusion facilitator family transporter
MGANVVLATAKILAGALGHSYVLIADGIESALDIAGSGIIWGGLKFASRPPDETHPYGHGKAEPVAAIIVSLGVLAAALVIAIQSVREIFRPHHAPEPFTLVVLVAVVVVKELLFRAVDRLGRDAKHRDQTDAGIVDRRVDFDRSFHWHLDRAHRRAALAKCGCMGGAFAAC